MCWNAIIEKKRYRIPSLIMFLSGVPLAFALISQYFFGLHPCELCIRQRIPLYIILGVSFLFLLIARKKEFSKAILILGVIAFLVTAGIAAFHVGVEQGWWKGTDTCGNSETPDNIEDLRKMIMEAPLAKCDEATYILPGISMALGNVVYSFGVAIFLMIIFIKLRNRERIINGRT